MWQKLSVSWDLPNHNVELRRFNRYLRDKGVRPSTLTDYLQRASKYLEFADLISRHQRRPKNTEIIYWIANYLDLRSTTIVLQSRTSI